MEPEEARCVWAYMSRPPALRFDAVDGASLQTLFTELGPAESVFLSVMINEFVLQLMEDLQDSLNDCLVEVGENPVVRAHWSAVIRTCEEHARLHPSVRRMIRTGGLDACRRNYVVAAIRDERNHVGNLVAVSGDGATIVAPKLGDIVRTSVYGRGTARTPSCESAGPWPIDCRGGKPSKDRVCFCQIGFHASYFRCAT